ncbi:hypothetical protein [Desulfobaculum bizertense]|uniref:Uncharacterized protein n=1 Tax=Desulfobaculum bizertense DSM 18034 TaxID=1121442 RepID=A0A1T4WKC9_9BACT|nr:hypothetical protein [Desulfobaculum bizertense]UIJ37094.1 hypothetical protein LWC08_10155 [Desulfobaculum bizertense]SKA77806.1 hypothetical protein SAMN02745702_02386 [Desulfobaculum bizertense DSM 18034]
MEEKQAQLLKMIQSLYPEAESHGVTLHVEQEVDGGDWLVTIRKDADELRTHISDQEATDCLEGKKCVHLGMQIGTFIKNYCLGGGSCIV